MTLAAGALEGLQIGGPERRRSPKKAIKLQSRGKDGCKIRRRRAIRMGQCRRVELFDEEVGKVTGRRHRKKEGLSVGRKKWCVEKSGASNSLAERIFRRSGGGRQGKGAWEKRREPNSTGPNSKEQRRRIRGATRTTQKKGQSAESEKRVG